MPDEFGWYYVQNNESVGPVTLSQLIAALPRIGGKDALVFGPSSTQWTEARHIGELAHAIFGRSSKPPQLPPTRKSHDIDYEIFGAEMQYVVIELDPGETVVAEPGAMMFQSSGIEMKTVFGNPSGDDGGLLGKVMTAGKRLLTGESLFVTTFTHVQSSGKEQVGFAAPYPGKIVPMHLDDLGGELICQKNAYLCSAQGISIGIAFQKKFGVGLFGGEGFIMQRLTGDGIAMVHAGGTLMKRMLAAGETLRVDTGCLVALVPSVQYDIQFVGGFKNTLFGGEGLFFATVTGPGDVWLQSLPFSRLAGRVLSAGSALGRSKDEGSVLGGIGNMFMGGNQ